MRGREYSEQFKGERLKRSEYFHSEEKPYVVKKVKPLKLKPPSIHDKSVLTSIGRSKSHLGDGDLYYSASCGGEIVKFPAI